MKKTIITISTIFLFTPTFVKCQNDSIEIHNIGDNYIEIKILRYKLDSVFTSDYGEVFAKSFIPAPTKLNNGTIFIPASIKLNNGTILIKDRLDRTLVVYNYSDSIIVNEEHYNTDRRMQWQIIRAKNNSYEIYKVYWENGNLEQIRFYGNGLDESYFYSENGKIIDRKK